MFHLLRKHIFCLTLALMFIFLVTIGCAETVNLSSMSDTDVAALLVQVNDEVVARGIQKTAKLSKGAYIAGKDIPVGSYVYTCLAAGEDWGNVTIYSEEGNGKQLMWNVVTAPEEGAEPETIFINLNPGDQLKSGVPFSLTISAGVLFK